MYNGKIADMKDLGVREAYKSKLKVLRLPTCERLPYAEHNDQQCRQALINFPLSPKISTWRSALSEYRNVNTHDAFHDTSDPAHAFDKLYGMNLHLLDLLVRILLAKSGYNGPYRPIPAILAGTQRPLDWVQANTPTELLGYGNLL